KIKYLRPEIDIETRWNSTYYMLQKLQQMKTVIKMLAIKHEIIRNLLPDNIAWIKIKESQSQPQYDSQQDSTSPREYFRELKKHRLGIT
ncbi:379_t:CDS:2, partial [Funneliformis geosporum]